MERSDGHTRGYASVRSWLTGSFSLVVALAGASRAAQVTYQYDSAGRLTGVLYDDGAQATYTLDAAGNRTQVTTVAPTPIKAPQLTVTGVTSIGISLSWTAATGGSGQFTYNLYRNNALELQNITSTSTTDYIGPDASDTYTVAAVDSDGNVSPMSNSVSATTYAVPVVSAFTASTVSASQINLTWAASDPQGPGISSFRLLRNGSSYAAFSAATTSYSDTSVTPGTSYNYALQALDSAGGESNALTATASTYSLPVISSFIATTLSSSSINLAWTASDSGGPGGLTYSVMRGSTVLGCTASPCADTGLAPGTQYVYTVRARDSAGDQSSIITAQGPGMTFASAPGPITVGTIGLTTAALSWGAASGSLTNYDYLLNGQTFWNPINGTGTSTTLTGLASGTTYTVQIVAANLAGFGAPSSATFTTLYEDTPVMTAGNNDDGSEGFNVTRGFGSMSPATTSNGYTYNSFADLAPVGSGKYNETTFVVTGFAADPGQGWLISASVNGETETGASAGNYVFSAGKASWVWTNGPLLPSSGTYTCTIIHK